MARTAYSPGRAVRKPMYKKRKLIVKPGFLLVAAFVCYFNMGNILYPVAAAVAVHEAGHYIGMKALSVKVERVVLGCAGPVSYTHLMSFCSIRRHRMPKATWYPWGYLWHWDMDVIAPAMEWAVEVPPVSKPVPLI